MADVYGMADVDFDFGAAETLAQVASSSATSVRGLERERAARAVTAQADFRGYFALLFADNVATGSTDAANLAACLDRVASYTRELITAAEEENVRRQQARDWAERQRQREENLLVDIYYNLAFWESKDPPPTTRSDPPSYSAGDINLARHDLPARGGGSGGGVSSANPSHLRAFSLPPSFYGSFESDGPARLRRAWNDFVSGCKWGTLDASGTVNALDQWVEANKDERSWVNAVAAAFEAAGTSGGTASLSDASLLEALAQAGLDPVRGTLALDPPELYGINPTTGYSNDPVNTVTGNFIEPETDLGFGGAASALGLTRMYNSQSTARGLFGLGWTSSLETRLRLDGAPCLVLPDGREVRFAQLPGDEAAAEPVRAESENFWLTRAHDPVPWLPAETELLVSDNRGTRWAFTAAGVWLAVSSGAGTAVTARRDASGRVAGLVHACGRSIEIRYDGDLVAAVQSSDGRRVDYSYDAKGRLCEAREAVGARVYRWNDDDLIVAVTSAAGVVEAENVYDAEGRVVRQITEFGREVRFAYLPGRVTAVSDLDGTNSNTWIADRRGRLIGVIDGDDNRVSMAYDRYGNRTKVVDRDGSVTEHVYDERGRLTQTRLPDGGEITTAYDEFDRVVTVVASSGGMVEYSYASDEDRNPSVIRDAAGGETALTWQNGLLTEVIDPAGVCLRMAYDEHGELVATTNGAGDAARLERDGMGRVSVAISPSGHRTEFGYDEATGLLAERIDADGARWRFEHTAGGRLAAVTDPLGGRTALEYGPHGELVKTVDPLGREVSREFDLMGNVSRLHLPDGASWVYEHDALSRVRGVTDPGGSRWSADYDELGRLDERVSPAGVVESFAYSRAKNRATAAVAGSESSLQLDEFGRPRSSQSFDGAESVVGYDAAGRVVEVVDAEGGLTTIGYDLAGRIVQVRSAAGRVTGYEYDACGRLARSIDPAGAVTQYEYDADSLVSAVVSPSGETTRFAYDPMGRLVRREAPGEGVARISYDALGRVVFSQDARLGQRRFGYDAAGQLTSATNGMGGVTRFAYDLRGRLVSVTDPLGGVMRREYDALDRVVSVTDPLGRATTASYDADGRQLSRTDPDGHVTEWRYDEYGRHSATLVDGVEVSAIHRDLSQRVVTVREPGGEAHTLRYDALGRLVERARGGQAMRWEYDADGARSAAITPDGARIEYERDSAGRLTAVRHPVLGEARYEYDAFGRMVLACAGDTEQRWEHDRGSSVRHTLIDPSGVSETVIVRDDDGRVRRIEHGASWVEYGYDEACQLVSARDERGRETRWRYDEAGRLLEEQQGDEARGFSYDAAGQLLAVNAIEGSARFSYDGCGRRLAERYEDRTVGYAWSPSGWLTSVTTSTPEGEQVLEVRVDALGELAGVDGTQLWWDTASPVPAPVAVDASVVLPAPGFTGVSGVGWAAVGWRAARSTSPTDPWSAGADAVRVVGAVQVTASGGVMLAGLEWLDARVYDPAVRGFLSKDPLPPVVGAGWAGNPYSYAGNDPLHAVDPLGLRPMTDAELTSYADSWQGAMAQTGAAIGHWWSENWEYVAAGAMIVAGVALMFTGVGGPVGIALMAGSGALLAGGISTVSQKAQTGQVDWGKVGVDALVGGAMGAAGGVGAMAVKSITGGTASATRSLIVNAGVNGGVGGVGGGVGYLSQNNWQIQNGWAFAGSIAGGSVAGTVGGIGGPAAGTLANKLGVSSTGWQSQVMSAGFSGVGAAGGSIVRDVVSGDEINLGNAGWNGLIGGGASGITNTLAPKLPFAMQGTNTLSQMPHFHPRSLNGAFNMTQHNTQGLWGGAVVGEVVGGAADWALGTDGVLVNGR